MRCVEFEWRLNELLDDRVDPIRDDQLASHAQSCEKCEDLLHWNSAVMGALPVQDLDPVRLDGFTTSNRGQFRNRGQFTFRAAWAVLAVVAAVVVCVSLLPNSDTAEQGADQPAALETERSNTDMLALWGVLDQFSTGENTRFVTEPTRFVTEPIVGGIRPIRNSLGMAFGALRDTLPGKRRNGEPQAGQHAGHISRLTV
ncbi:MAG: hypothetical protein ABGX07_17035 [Pirellulaceae bacterium]